MINDFLSHNLFKRSIDEFLKFDPHLMKLEGLPFIHRSKLEKEIPLSIPGIYILTGGRQVGKSTLLKLIISRLLTEDKIPPKQIYYLPCDIIENFKQLLLEIEQFQSLVEKDRPFYLFIDEVTYVRDWDKAIKFLADAGFLNLGSICITGSDSIILKDAMMRFPGRRGRATEQDFHLYPLSFFEFIELQEKEFADRLKEARQKFNEDFKIEDVSNEAKLKLKEYFEKYLLSGGYILAINDIAANGVIALATFKTYLQWIIGDLIKKGKSENYLRELISALIPRAAKQVTWHSLTENVSIEHHQTVADYFSLLERMDVVVIQEALREDKLQGSAKKAKKIGFGDPFIFHTLHSWIKNETDAFGLLKKVVQEKSDLKNSLIEGAIVSLFKRRQKPYYIKAEGEVDIALIHKNSFIPIEIKCSQMLNRKDIKQILKYKNGIVGYDGLDIGNFEQLDVIPIPLLAALAC